jgi:serine/threonine protein kinase
MFKENRNREQLGHLFPQIPISHPRKGTCSNIWQVGAVMNILLKGQKINFNKDGSNPRSKLDRVHNYNPGMGFGFNHSLGLDHPDCANRYSRRLRDLVKDCLLREPLTRPSSIQLVQRTTEGLECTVQVIQGTTPSIPPSIAFRKVSFVAISNPEPPLEWTIDTSEFELDMRDEELLASNAPTDTAGGKGF